MENPPAFLFYPKDFLSSISVQTMKAEEVGAYWLLLSNSWIQSNPCFLPKDEKLLMKISRLDEAQWKNFSKNILENFSVKNEKIYNPRLLREYKRLMKRRKTQRDNGVKGGRPKKNKAENGKPTGNPRVSNPKPKKSFAVAVAVPSSVAVSSSKKKKEMLTTMVPPPAALKGLELYEKNEKLLKRWEKLFPSWEDAYPNIDIPAEIKRAHAWELANPRNAKKDKARFLNNWFSRTYPNGSGNKEGGAETEEEKRHRINMEKQEAATKRMHQEKYNEEWGVNE